MTYTDEQIEQFRDELDRWMEREDDLTTALITRQYRKPETSELVRHGLLRRLATLKHCIERTFDVLPPDMVDPDDDALMDATSLVQTFVINLFGAIDNLATIWCWESDLRKPNGKVPGPIR